jgi:hypothetical protein
MNVSIWQPGGGGGGRVFEDDFVVPSVNNLSSRQPVKKFALRAPKNS